MPDPFERVRHSTRRVIEAAQLVSWDVERLRVVSEAYEPAQIRAAHTFDSQYHWQGTGEAQLNYVFVTEALNFGSGLSPLWKKLEATNLVQGSLYKTVADTMRRAMEAGQSLDPAWAASLTGPQLAAFFGLPPDFELVGDVHGQPQRAGPLGRRVATKVATATCSNDIPRLPGWSRRSSPTCPISTTGLFMPVSRFIFTNGRKSWQTTCTWLSEVVLTGRSPILLA